MTLTDFVRLLKKEDDMMRNVKRIIALMIAFILTLMSVIMGMPCKSKAADGRNAALNAYKEFLKKDSIRLKVYGKETDFYLKQERFAVCDLNHDNIPELVIDSMADHGEAIPAVVFTFYAKKIRTLVVCDHGYPLYYKKGSVFGTEHTNRGYYIQSTYQITKGKVKKIAEITDDSAVGDKTKGKEFYVGGKKVNKQQYESFIKKKTTSIKQLPEQLVYHDITNENIKKYCK